MFRVTHTTPKKVLSHLLRLQREGEALLGQAQVSALDEGKWADRVFRYLKKISTDPETFERLIWKNMVPMSLDFRPRALPTLEEMTKIQKKHVQKTMITLAGAIEQFEAQYEE